MNLCLFMAWRKGAPYFQSFTFSCSVKYVINESTERFNLQKFIFNQNLLGQKFKANNTLKKTEVVLVSNNEV